jgi:tetratricopeptide (TPR) repeat protein
VGEADIAIARTELYSGNYAESTNRYRAAGHYLSSGRLLAETGVSMALAGDLDGASELLIRADKLNNVKPSGTPGADRSLAFKIVTSPLKVVGLVGGGIRTSDQPVLSVSIPQSLAVVYTVQGAADPAQIIMNGAISIASKTDFDSPENARAAAIAYANAAEMQEVRGDRREALELYKESASRFEGLNDNSAEYLTMSESYTSVLVSAKKFDLARAQAHIPDKLKSD